MDILDEVKALMKQGVQHFRLGKQTDFYSYKNGKSDEIKKILEPISKLSPRVLHIDNANPARVNEDITKLIVEYCTAGNIAAFGVESFDEKVIKQNCLNSNPEIVMKAVKIINKYGKARGSNGMPKFLPGINILLGLIGENKETLEIDYEWLKKILDSDLWLRRINIRLVVPFIGTMLSEEAGTRYIKKNRKYYYSFRKKVRQDIDFEMLKKITPKDTVLRDVQTEIWDGRHTFARQIGSYPLIVGINKRIPLNQFIDVKVTDHMLRSVVGEVNE